MVHLAKGVKLHFLLILYLDTVFLDPKIMEKSGKVLITGDLGAYYGFVDINGMRFYHLHV